MEGNLELVYDLAIIFITAGITTLIFKILKQPLILGYIVAGLLVGPHLGLFPHAIGAESVEQWSEIGIIFLLFSLGLEFSFKKLPQKNSRRGQNLFFLYLFFLNRTDAFFVQK